jgi:hypothetical protein
MNRAILAAVALLSWPALSLAQDGPKPDAPAPAKPAETDEQYLSRMSTEMMRKVEEIRGLKFKKDVERVWKSRDEARAEMLAELDKQAEKEDLGSVSKALALFGLIKEGGDLKAIFADFIAAAAGGYYLPEKKVFSLVRGFPEDMCRPVVFHELIHAVEDQYYDFQERTDRNTAEKKSDPNEALHALVEGSARMYENRFVDSEEGLRPKYMKAQMAEAMKQMAAVMKAPPCLTISVGMFPYENGSAFLAHVLPALRAGPDGKEIPDVDIMARLYADPPVSTEQILHPEKYLGERDLPRTVRLPDGSAALGDGWKRLVSDGWGELTTGLILNAGLLPNNLIAQVQAVAKPDGSVEFQGDTLTAVTGWDGDAYGVYENGDRRCFAWVSVWDAPAEAAEFAEVYGKLIARKYGTVAEVKGEDGKTKKKRVPPDSLEVKLGEWTGTRWSATRDGDSAVLVMGDRVLVVERAPSDALTRFAEASAKAEIVQDARDAVPARAK